MAGDCIFICPQGLTDGLELAIGFFVTPSSTSVR